MSEQTSLALQEQSQEMNMMGLLQLAIEKGASVETLERLAALKIQMDNHQMQVDHRQAEIAFDDALNICQQKIGRIAPNQQRQDSTKAWWADYAHLDRTIRPIYSEQGFSVAFDEVTPISVGKVRIRGALSRKGISRDYHSEITPSTTGAKGNALVNATDADAIAGSRARRYILISMFNIAIGIDKEEKQGVPQGEGLGEQQFISLVDNIEASGSEEALKKSFFAAANAAREAGDPSALKSFEQAKNKTWKANNGWRA